MSKYVTSFIQSIKKDLLKAIKNLNLIEEYETKSFLDFTIFMALYYLKLHIIERIIIGKNPYPNDIE